jgi:hypothetical protein
MAGDNEALQADEQGEDDLTIPGQDQGEPADFSQTGAGISSQQPQAGMAPPGGPQAPQQAQTPQGGPQVSGKAGFLGNLLKTLLSGVQNAPGNPNNAFDRGYMQQSPNNQAMQQAKVQTAQSEADQAKIQTSVTGMKALQMEYLLKRLPVEDQMKHMEVISKFKDNLIKEGASVEAEAGDEKAGDAQAMHLNGTDPRAMNHSGHFWSMPTMDENGKPKFDVVYVPTKDVLQNDFKWEDADGNEHTIAAGTPMLGLPKMVEQMQKDVQGDTKSQHKQMGDALKPNVPDGEIPQTVKWLQNQQKQNTPLYQQNKNAVDAQINMLNAAHSQIHAERQSEARAGAQMKSDIKQDELTSSTKTMTEAAPRVLELADRVTKLIDEQVKTLGPAGSRWNEFMAGKVGAPNPEFTKLRTNVGLLTTLLMRMHVGARGGEYIMKHFQDLIDSGKQSPENLKAAIGEIRTYAQDVAKEGGKEAPAPKTNGKTDTSSFDPSLFPKAQ